MSKGHACRREGLFRVGLGIWLQDKSVARKISGQLKILHGKTRQQCGLGFTNETQRHLTRCIAELQSNSANPPTEGWETWVLNQAQKFVQERIAHEQAKTSNAVACCVAEAQHATV